MKFVARESQYFPRLCPGKHRASKEAKFTFSQGASHLMT